MPFAALQNLLSLAIPLFTDTIQCPVAGVVTYSHKDRELWCVVSGGVQSMESAWIQGGRHRHTMQTAPCAPFRQRKGARVSVMWVQACVRVCDWTPVCVILSLNQSAGSGVTTVLLRSSPCQAKANCKVKHNYAYFLI